MSQMDACYGRAKPLPPGYLDTLGIPSGSSAAQFYSEYSGPFCSRNTAFMLLDVGDPALDESVERATLSIRAMFGWPARYLVISDVLAHSVLVYDTTSDSVFDVDFEGGDLLLVSGNLPASFATFNDFLAWYFPSES